MCKFFEVSRSGYYAYLKRKDTPAKDLPLAEKIRECQEQNHRTYGYRRVHIWLERQGIYCNGHWNGGFIYSSFDYRGSLQGIRKEIKNNFRDIIL